MTGTISPKMDTWKLLWTNSAPSSNFSSKKVPLDLSEYDAVLIIFKFAPSDSAYHSLIGIMGLTMIMEAFYNYRGYRTAAISDTGVTFGGGMSASQTGSLASTDGVCIPYEIYGIKGIIA